MIRTKPLITTFNNHFTKVLLLAALIVLYILGLSNYLLFHSLVELFSITVASCVFIVAWESQPLHENGFLTILGVSSLFVALIDILHLLSYRGMQIFPVDDANLPTQLWIANRYLFSISLLAAVPFLHRKIKPRSVFVFLSAVTLLLVGSIFAGIFPACYLPGMGLTPFKIYSEYLISGIFVFSLFLLIRKRKNFDPYVLRWLSAFIIASVLGEMAFTEYVSVYAPANMFGHILIVISFYSLYKALVETGFNQPYRLLFRNLKTSEEALRLAHNELEKRVEERTAELKQANTRLQIEIAERKRVQEALEQSAQQLEDQSNLLHSILKQAANAIVVSGEDGKILFCNPAARQIAGIPENMAIQISPESWGAAYSPEGQAVPLEEWPLYRALRGETTVGQELHMLRPDGSTYDILISSAPLRGNGDEVNGAVAVFADITSKKQAELDLQQAKAELEKRVSQRTYELQVANQRLLEVNEQLQLAVWGSNAGIWDIHLNPEKPEELPDEMFINPDMKRIMGYEENEFPNRLSAWTALILPEDQPKLEEATYAHLRGETELFQIEYRLHDKEGGLHWIDSRGRMIRDAHGTPIRFSGIAWDITAQKLAAKRLEEANQELQDFAFVASHDLQEPLRKIQAFGNRLSERHQEALGEDGQDYLNRMINAANRMQSMIDGLLAYSRVNTKGRPFVKVDLIEVTSGVIDDLEARLEHTSGRVEVAPLPSIEADPVQMRQLFQNLIGNGLKFHKPDTPPLVKVWAQKTPTPESPPGVACTDKVCIFVQDNGIGFDEKFAERIFQPFQRLHGRSEYEGHGMGLAICRKIIARHHGEIVAHSRPGQGSTFVITLPLKHHEN